MAEFQRDAKIIQTLYDIPLQTAGVWHQFGDCLYLRPFQGHSSCHDQSDISGAKDHNTPARHEAVDIDQFLGSPCSVDPCRPESGYVQGSSGSFPAAHGKDYRFCPQLHQSLFMVQVRYDLVAAAVLRHRNTHHHGAETAGDLQFPDLVNKALGIFRTGQFLFERMQSETIMDTLVQDPAQTAVPLQNKNTVFSGFLCLYGSCKTRRPAADNCDLRSVHLNPSASGLTGEFIFADNDP